MAPNNSQSDATPIDLNVLESQLSLWKAYEREHGKPYPFNSAMRTALSIIMLPSTEPDIDDHNYIGDLQERLQKQGDGNLSKPEEEDMIEPSTGQTRFRAWYQIPDIKGRFPREGFGYGNGEAAPTFSQKRKARQFAARQAMAWLSSSSRSGASSGGHVNDDAVKEEQAENDDYDYDVGMNENYNDNHSGKGKGRDEFNDNGGYLHQPPSPQNSLGRNKIRIGDAEGQNGASIAPPGQTSRTPKMPRSGNNSNSYANEDEETESPSLFKRVEKKCKNLGIDPPKYNIKLDEAGRWYGQPSLWADGRMPGDMGVVRDILSKEQAKIEMAEQVLAWLVGEERIRKKEVETMLNSRF